VLSLVCSILNIYVIVIFARIIMEWIRVPGDHPVAQIKRGLATVVDPLLLPIRRVVPSVPLGGMRLDLSPLLLLLAVQFAARLVGC